MPKILIADDSIAVRKVAERLLTEAGMESPWRPMGRKPWRYWRRTVRTSWCPT